MVTSECHAILEEAKRFASGEFSRTSIAKCEDMLQKITAAEKAIDSGEVVLDAHNTRVFQINFAMAKSTAESILETAEEREA